MPLGPAILITSHPSLPRLPCLHHSHRVADHPVRDHRSCEPARDKQGELQDVLVPECLPSHAKPALHSARHHLLGECGCG